MDPERWQIIQDLFDQALEREPDERAAFLQGATSGDPDLQQEVESLLASDAAAGDVLGEALSDGLELYFDGEAEGPASGRFGKYDLLEKIGEGGFGTVYRGHDPQLQRTVAIKTCTAKEPTVQQRFVREARLAASLQHPHIVTVHDFGEENGLPYLVQELLDGEDLQARIGRRESVPVATAQSYLLQIAQGLAYAHDQKVLHRDIKPENIRVLPGGRIKILDFGIACLVSEQRRLTGAHRALGTAGYMAPEQLQGGDVDARSDMFAFGVLAYQLLGLERPFDGTSFADISQRILDDDPTPLRRLRSSVPGPLADLVHRCLAKSPDHRFASMRQVADTLAEMGDGAAAAAPAGTRWPLWVAAGSVAVATAALGALLMLSSENPASEPQVPVHEAREPEGVSRPPDMEAEDASESEQPQRSVSEADSGEVASATQMRRPEPSAPPKARPGVSTQEGGGEAGAPAQDGATTSTPMEISPVDSSAPEPGAADFQEAVAALPADSKKDPDALRGPISPTTQADITSPGSQLATQPMEGPPEPILVRRVEPTYPALARRRGVEGEVRVAILVDAAGGIRQTAVTFSSALDLGFEEAALEAAKKATFQPAEMGGNAVQAWIELTYTFRLR